MTQNIGKQENLRFDNVKFYSVLFDILGKPSENTDINLDIMPKILYHSEKPKLKDGKEQLKSYYNATGALVGI